MGKVLGKSTADHNDRNTQRLGSIRQSLQGTAPVSLAAAKQLGQLLNMVLLSEDFFGVCCHSVNGESHGHEWMPLLEVLLHCIAVSISSALLGVPLLPGSDCTKGPLVCRIGAGAAGWLCVAVSHRGKLSACCFATSCARHTAQ